MSRDLHDYLALKKDGRRGWRSEYEDRLTESVIGDKKEFLARWYMVRFDEFINEVTDKEVDRIIDRLAERMTNPGEVAP